MRTVLEELRSRGHGRVEGRGPTHFAHDTTRLLYREPAGVVLRAEVFAVSPSAAGITLAQREIAGLLPRLGAAKFRIVSQSANEVAVALHVQVGDLALLLGSDLEARAETSVGWHAVVGSQTRPRTPAHAFKVPHHGSKTGHEQSVWAEMLTTDRIAALTPFSPQALPREEDVKRIKALTDKAFLAAPPTTKKTKRSGTVDRTIASATTRFRQRSSKMGQIRVRWHDAQPTVELFGAAHSL